MPDEYGLTPFEEKRIKLGVPEEWRGNQVLHIRAYRGVGDDLFSGFQRTLYDEKEEARARRQFAEARRILCMKEALGKRVVEERNMENTMLINLDVEGIPDDFPHIVMQRLIEDHARRKVDFMAKTLEQPVSALGVWLVLMAPLDEKGRPLPRRGLRGPVGDDEVKLVGVKGDGPLDGLDFNSLFKRPAIFETFIRASEPEKFTFFMRAVAGANYNEDAIPAVRERLAKVLQL
jgi:hypothetical protein